VIQCCNPIPGLNVPASEKSNRVWHAGASHTTYWGVASQH
jgi:hypothetical protein